MPLSKWYLFIQKAVQIMNKKTKLANFNPPQLAKYYTNNRMKYNFIGLPEEEFKFSMGVENFCVNFRMRKLIDKFGINFTPEIIL